MADTPRADLRVPRQWRVHEMTLRAARRYDDPLYDVAVTALFTAPNGHEYTIPTFWDGGNRWKIRFTPTMPGAWSYRVTCNRTDDTGLHGREGVWVVEPARGRTRIVQHGGFLRVSENRHHLTYADGTPFFWLGDTWWFCPSHLVPFDGSTNPAIPSMYKELIKTRKAQGFSTVHMAFLNSGVNGSYTSIFEGTVNPQYWQDVDRYIVYANANDIIPVIGMGFHTGLNAPTLEQLQTLWAYVLARYGAYAVTWLICGEYNLVESEDGSPLTERNAARVAKMLQVGQFIKAHDPYQRAMTIHPWWHGGDGRQAWDESWYDFIMFQGGHSTDGPPHEVYRNAYQRANRKPVLKGECTYEGIYDFDDAVVRHTAYQAIQCGSFGYTYGVQGLWYPNQDENDTTFSEGGRQFLGGKRWRGPAAHRCGICARAMRRPNGGRSNRARTMCWRRRCRTTSSGRAQW